MPCAARCRQHSEYFALLLYHGVSFIGIHLLAHYPDYLWLGRLLSLQVCFLCLFNRSRVAAAVYGVSTTFWSDWLHGLVILDMPFRMEVALVPNLDYLVALKILAESTTVAIKEQLGEMIKWEE